MLLTSIIKNIPRVLGSLCQELRTKTECRCYYTTTGIPTDGGDIDSGDMARKIFFPIMLYIPESLP